MLILVDVEVGECGTGNCPADQRPVTVTPVLDLDLDAVIGADILDQLLTAALAVAVFEDVTITDAQGNVVATVAPGDTVCLEPGTFTAETSLLNADAVIDEIDALALGITIEDVIVVEETFTVQQCPADGGDDDDGGGDIGSGNTQYIDIDAGNCAAIIANAGVQYGDSSIVQECQQIINNITAGGDVNNSNAINGDATTGGGSSNAVANAIAEGGDGGDALAISGNGADGANGGTDGNDVDGGGDGVGGDGAGGDFDPGAVSSGGASGGGVGDDSDPGVASGGGLAAVASGGVLPDTGGASLIALGAGVLLIGGGLLARRIMR